MRGLFVLPPSRLTRFVLCCGIAVLLFSLGSNEQTRVLLRTVSWLLMFGAGVARLSRRGGSRQTFAIALILSSAAFAVSNAVRYATADASFLSEITNALGSVLILVAGTIFIRRARPDRRHELVLDGLIGGFAATILVREGLLILGAEPSVFTADAFFVIMVSVGAAMWIRILFRVSSDALSLFALALALALPPMAVVALQRYGILRPIWIDLFTIMGVCVLAVAVSHPQIHDPIPPVSSEIESITPARAIGIAFALLVLPVASVSRLVIDSPPDLVAVGTTVGLSLLFTVRFSLIVLQRDRLRAALITRLNTDELTGVSSRVHLLAALESALEDLGSGDIEWAGLMFIDLDGFKAINDQHGHRAGDQVLDAVAGRFSEVLGEHDHLGRIAGDEFGILTLNRDEMGMEELSSEVERALAAPILLATGSLVEVSCAVGRTMIRASGDSAEAALDRADAAMYRSKAAQRSAPADRVTGEMHG